MALGNIAISITIDEQFKKDLKNAKQEVDKFAKSVDSSLNSGRGGIGGFLKGLSGVSGAATSFGSTLKSVGNSIKDFGGGISNAGFNLLKFEGVIAGVVGGLTLLGSKILDGAGKLEQNRAALNALIGSQERANQLLKELSQFAVKTPFQLDQLQDLTKQLVALGFAADDVLPILDNLGNIGAALGFNKDDFDRVIFNLGQIRNQGRATLIDIRQFAIAGIPIYEALADTMGKSVGEIQEMVSAGIVGYPQVAAALKSLTDEGGRFNGQLETQSKTFKGVISNLKDLGLQFLNLVGGIDEAGNIIEGGFLDTVRKALFELLTFLNENREAIRSTLITISKTIGQVLQFIFKLIKERPREIAIIAALAVAIPPLLIAFGALVSVIGSVIGVLGTLSTIIGAILTPVGLVVVAVLALVAAFVAAFVAAGVAVVALLKYFGVLDTIVNRVKLFIKNLASQFSSIGNQIGGGLLSGLQRATELFLTGLSKMIIAGITLVERLLGIASPSKVFEGIGDNIGLGLAKGISGSFGPVLSSLSKLSDQVRDVQVSVGKSVRGVVVDIGQLNRLVTEQELIFREAEKATQALVDKYELLQKQLDEVINTPLLGEGEFKKQRSALERQIKELELQKLNIELEGGEDIEAVLRNLERLEAKEKSLQDKRLELLLEGASPEEIQAVTDELKEVRKQKDAFESQTKASEELDDQIDQLQKQLEKLNLEYELSIGEQKKLLEEMGKPQEAEKSFEELADEAQKLRKELDKLGPAVKEAQDFTDIQGNILKQLQEIRDNAEKFGIKSGIVIPEAIVKGFQSKEQMVESNFQDAMDTLEDLSANASQTISDNFGFTFEELASMFQQLQDLKNGKGGADGGLGGQIGGEGLFGDGKGLFDDLLNTDGISSKIDAIKEKIKGFVDGVKTAIEPLRPAFEKIGEFITKIIDKIELYINASFLAFQSPEVQSALQELKRVYQEELKPAIDEMFGSFMELLRALGLVSDEQDTQSGKSEEGASKTDELKKKTEEFKQTLLFIIDVIKFVIQVIKLLIEVQTFLFNKVTELINKFNEFRDKVNEIGRKIKEFFDNLPTRIEEAKNSVVEKAKQFGKDIVNGIVSGIASIGSSIGNKIREFIPSASSLRNLLPFAKGGLVGGVQNFAKGGMVKSLGKTLYAAKGAFTPKGTDTVPAMLTPGELVIPRNLVKGIFDLFRKLGSLPGVGRSARINPVQAMDNLAVAMAEKIGLGGGGGVNINVGTINASSPQEAKTRAGDFGFALGAKLRAKGLV